MRVPDDCLICAKHRGEGPLGGELIARLDRFWVWHAPPGEDGTAPLGHLVMESDQHRPYVSDLTDEEAAALGRLRTRLAKALRAEVSPSFVFAAVIGTGVAHFHEHLICRHQGTPAEVPWHGSDEAGPQVDREMVADLARRLGERLATEPSRDP
jgi:diadenosine tetraphosphate (Ap4A) HIT family hydrolase